MKILFEAVRRKMMLALVTAAAVSIGSSSDDAIAGNFCTDINRLVAEAPEDFSDVIIESGRGSGGFDVTLKLEGASNCAVRRLLHAKSYYCTWEFQHRDVNAYKVFEELGQKLKSCVGGDAILSNDQGVNHPDFYDARIFQLDDVKVAVSVKDKSTLGATYVFVSVERLKGS
ncbi:MAG: hypothetical protein ACRBM6_34715 [Geminicoccales bacterium]